MYNVYVCHPTREYRGLSIIAASDVNHANSIIEEGRYSTYYGFSEIRECDLIKELHSDVAGVIYDGIDYYG